MTTTFQKRQKEMKRIEKRKMKEEKRAQRKVDKTTARESGESSVLDDMIDYNHTNDMGPEN
ncbi:MAG: hypothetical protein NVS9B4_09540 [Candidatus Acidiferrum sp.]